MGGMPCVNVVIATHDREELFRERMAHANMHISLEQWEAEYGPVTIEYPWGITFWAGFERTMHRYLTYHLRGHRFEYFRKGYFKKPAPFGEPKDIWTPARQEGQACYPCFFCVASGEKVKMVCINIGFYHTRPWSVHHSWVIDIQKPLV